MASRTACLLLTGALGVASACSAAVTRSHESERVLATAHEVVAASLVREIRIGDQSVALDSTSTFASVHAALGFEGRVQEHRILDERLACYRLSDAGSAYLALRTNSLGGPRMTVLGFSIDADDRGLRNLPCAPLRLPLSSVATDRGLRIGVDSSSVLRTLGPPDSVSADRWYYSRFLEQPDEVVASSELQFVFQRGMARRIEGWFVRTK